mmetsp:Transcript_66210/g.145233  ORF Transcript_66210/g.145233 Transcript_66210/m.145233 type:complete len:82 (-) Transcript_66210:13-258(-)
MRAPSTPSTNAVAMREMRPVATGICGGLRIIVQLPGRIVSIPERSIALCPAVLLRWSSDAALPPGIEAGVTVGSSGMLLGM